MISQRFSAIIEVLKQRKIVFITLAALLIVLILILSLSQNFQSSPAVIQPTITPENTNNNARPVTIIATSVPVNLNLPKWNTYEGSSFSMEHSPEWFAQNGNIAGGGELVVIKPSILPPEINYPYFIIQTQPAAQGVVEQKTEIMRALGMKESEMFIFGQKARKLSGTVLIKNAGGTTLREPVQETNILFIHENLIYTMQYAYDGSEINNDMEEYFKGLINGVKLK